MKDINFYYLNGNVHYFFYDFLGKGRRELAIFYKNTKRMSRNIFIMNGKTLPFRFNHIKNNEFDVTLYTSACVFDENKTPKFFDGNEEIRTERASYIKWRDEDMPKAILYRDFFFDMDYHPKGEVRYGDYLHFIEECVRLWDILSKYGLKFRAISSGKGMHFVIDGEFMMETGFNFNQRSYDFYENFYLAFKKRFNLGHLCEVVASCADQLMKLPYSISSGNVCIPIKSAVQIYKMPLTFVSYADLGFSPRERGLLWQYPELSRTEQKERFFKLLKNIDCKFIKK